VAAKDAALFRNRYWKTILIESKRTGPTNFHAGSVLNAKIFVDSYLAHEQSPS
jgi:hypothetical protein